MSYRFGTNSQAVLAKCHPQVRSLADHALALSLCDFSVTSGEGRTLTLAPYPDDPSRPGQVWTVANAVWEASGAAGVQLQKVAISIIGGCVRATIAEPAEGPPPASSQAAAPEPASAAAADSITHGGPAYEKLVAWLKAEEGFCATAYPCSEGKLTIGYGYNLEAHGVPAAKAKGLVWTRERADKALRAEVEVAMAELEAHWPRWDDEFDQVRQAVFVSGVYQLGTAGAATFKNTIACLRAHDFEGAVRNLNLSKWARQTPKRVGRITKMLLSGVWPAEVNGVTL
jgi:lysozyme